MSSSNVTYPVAFAAVIVFVTFASFTVVVLDKVAVITELPVPFTAFNVALFVPFAVAVITVVVPDVIVTAPCVPPFPVILIYASVVWLYVNVALVGFVKEIVLVYFCTVIVNVTFPDS